MAGVGYRSREGRLTRALGAAVVVVVTWYARPAHGSEAGSKSASQCFRPGVAFVSLYCGLGKVVRVQGAFLGVHRRVSSRACSHLDSDCHVDAAPQFNWARCERRHSCVQIVQRTSRTPLCNGRTPTYLQVNYTCVTDTLPYATYVTQLTPRNGESTGLALVWGNRNTFSVAWVAVDGKLCNREASSITPMPPVVGDSEQPPTGDPSLPGPTMRVTPPGMEVKAANICLNKTVTMPDLYVQSPGFPAFYPPGRDCRCEVRAAPLQTITVRFDEIKLATSDGARNQAPDVTPLCDDWLMLEAPQYRGAGVVVCKDVDPRRRSLQSRSSHIILHLHTAPGDGVTNRRGFKVMITGSGKGKLEIDCYETSAEVALSSIPPGVASVDPARPYALPPTNFGTPAAVGSGSVPVAGRRAAHPGTLRTCLLLLLIALTSTRLGRASL